MSNKVRETWNKLSVGETKGAVKRLYDDKCPFRAYCFYDPRLNSFGIGLSHSKNIKVDVSHFDKLSKITVKLCRDNSFADSNMLYVSKFKGTDDYLFEIFAELCENILMHISCQSTEPKAVKDFLNQLVKWEKLFEHVNKDDLSKERQLGLFGELSLLNDLLLKTSIPKDVIVKSWVGPESNIQDFQSKNWAIEVKTSASSNPQSVKINNEKQLDDSLQSNLYLFHLSLLSGAGEGETLNDKVTLIRDLLKEDMVALADFNMKLNQAGYFDYERILYDETRYRTRGSSFYKVETDFPRIRENELRNGVGNVSYSISLALCEKYLVKEEIIYQQINSSTE